jgi:hypothetical protein
LASIDPEPEGVKSFVDSCSLDSAPVARRTGINELVDRVEPRSRNFSDRYYQLEAQVKFSQGHPPYDMAALLLTVSDFTDRIGHAVLRVQNE